MGGLDRPDFCTEAEDGGFINDLSNDEKVDCGIDPFAEGGSYFDEFAQPDTRTVEELFPGDFENGNNAGAGNSCDIENYFNNRRRENGMAEIHDPECSTDGLEEDLEEQLELNS